MDVTKEKDILYDIEELTSKADGLVSAVSFLMDSESLLSDNRENEEKRQRVQNIVKTHDTCALLLWTLQDVLKEISAKINEGVQL